MAEDNRNHNSRKGKGKQKTRKRSMKRDIVLLIDVEATCWRGRPPIGMYNEIIEIGIAGLDYQTKEIKFKDSIIVKPKYSDISSFCTELTSITQEMVDQEGVSFAEACKILEEKHKSKDRIWMSWGDYDKNQFIRDCELNSVDNPFDRTHFNLCPLFSFAFGINEDLGVSGSLNKLGLEFEGNAHRGVDDAYNIARILQKIFIPLMKDPKYNTPKQKTEHEKLIEHLETKYNEQTLQNNIARVINKTTPTNTSNE